MMMMMGSSCMRSVGRFRWWTTIVLMLGILVAVGPLHQCAEGSSSSSAASGESSRGSATGTGSITGPPGTTTTTTTTEAPLPTTPAPPELVDTAPQKIDLIFSYFSQDDIANIRRVIANLVGVSVRRVELEGSNNRVGLLFGGDVRVRTAFHPRSASEISERSATSARDQLMSQVESDHGETLKLGVRNAVVVPVDSRLYVYKTYTTWDVLYTLLIIAGGIGFISFVVYVGYRFRTAYVFEQWELKEQARDKLREAAEKSTSSPTTKEGADAAAGDAGGTKDAAGGSAKDGGASAEALAMKFDRGDVDEEGRDLVSSVAAALAARNRARAEAERWSQRSLLLPTNISSASETNLTGRNTEDYMYSRAQTSAAGAAGPGGVLTGSSGNHQLSSLAQPLPVFATRGESPPQQQQPHTMSVHTSGAAGASGVSPTSAMVPGAFSPQGQAQIDPQLASVLDSLVLPPMDSFLDDKPSRLGGNTNLAAEEEDERAFALPPPSSSTPGVAAAGVRLPPPVLPHKGSHAGPMMFGGDF